MQKEIIPPKTFKAIEEKLYKDILTILENDIDDVAIFGLHLKPNYKIVLFASTLQKLFNEFIKKNENIQIIKLLCLSEAAISELNDKYITTEYGLKIIEFFLDALNIISQGDIEKSLVYTITSFLSKIDPDDIPNLFLYELINKLKNKFTNYISIETKKFLDIQFNKDGIIYQFEKKINYNLIDFYNNNNVTAVSIYEDNDKLLPEFLYKKIVSIHDKAIQNYIISIYKTLTLPEIHQLKNIINQMNKTNQHVLYQGNDDITSTNYKIREIELLLKNIKW